MILAGYNKENPLSFVNVIAGVFQGSPLVAKSKAVEENIALKYNVKVGK